MNVHISLKANRLSSCLAEAALHGLARSKFRAAAALLFGLTVLALGSGFLPRPAPVAALPAAEAEPPQAGRAADISKGKADAQGDPLPDGAIARLGTLRWRHEGEARLLAFSPDGKTVVAADQRPGIIFWDAATGRMLGRRLPPGVEGDPTALGPLVFSPDGKVLTWQNVRGIHLWDLSADKVLRCLAGPPVERHGIENNLIRFSPDGKTLAASGAGRTVVWRAADGKELVAFGK